MKRWIVWFCCVAFLSASTYVGYKAWERLLIQKELQADIQAEKDYLSSLEKSRLSSATKQEIMALSDENIAQLQQAAQHSKTVRQFHQQKQLLLEQWAQEDRLEAILIRERN